jgi:hypothetical protein
MDSCLRRNDGEKQRRYKFTMYDVRCTIGTLRGSGCEIEVESFSIKTEEKRERDLLYKELKREGEP